METKFDELYGLNVSGKTEKKGELTYLSWAWAWAEFKKIYPDATYTVKKNEENLPYFASKQGIIVYTEVTADNLTYEMWLPVMTYSNKAMTLETATMTDINKTIMRCLTKNLAMFGLGLYIYAGEDLPESETETDKKSAEKVDTPKTPVKPAETEKPKEDKPKTEPKPFKPPTAAQLDEIKNFNVSLEQIAKYLQKSEIEISYDEIEGILIKKRNQAKKAEEKAQKEAQNV